MKLSFMQKVFDLNLKPGSRHVVSWHLYEKKKSAVYCNKRGSLEEVEKSGEWGL